MTARSALHLVLCLVLCLGVGGVTGSVTSAEIPTWYAGLVKPSWTPPNWAFPVVWTLLYFLMGIALWLLWDRAPAGSARTSAIALFFAQLAFNAAWSPVFFSLHQTKLALGIIVLLALLIAATILAARRCQPTAALLLSPYFIWVAYAATLNAGIVAMNP